MVLLAYIRSADAAGLNGDQPGLRLDEQKAMGIESGGDAGAGLRTMDYNAPAANPCRSRFDATRYLLRLFANVE
jgi:hypothetical protein